MTLSVDQVVEIDILLSAPAPTARGFGTKLIMGKATVLPLYARVKEYADLTELVVDFISSTEEYKAAAIHFGQNPRPKKVKIGRQFLAAQAGSLRGGLASSTVADYTGISNGGFDITINGVNRQIFALDLSGAVSMAGVATLIQTKLAAALASTTCTWDATLKKFIITSPTTGPSSIVLPAVAPTGGSSPTDVSTLLALTVNAGAKSVNGIAIETMTAAWDAAAIFDSDFYVATVTAAMSIQDKKDTMAWVESNVREFFYTTNDPNALTVGDTSNLGYYAKNLTYRRSFGEYSGASPYAAESASARAGVVDFDQPNSTITLMYKQQPGVAVDDLTSGQVTALKSYNLNYYINRGGIAVLETGTMANGTFQDEVQGLDWFQAGLQNAIFSLLATTPTKIPQTDEGAAKIIDACNGFSAKARSNGLVAAGTWKGDAFGELKTGDYMPTGFYFSAGSVADMSQADKDARKSPPITGAILLAGAIHTVSVQVTVQR
jgi:hypothetical protein